MKRGFTLRRGLLGAAATVAVILGGVSLASVKAAEEVEIPKQAWSFSGMFGTYDRASLQRGYQVYKEVCSNCHGLFQLSYRNLADLGFSPDEVKALAAEAQVTDGPNDEGQMFQRAGRPSDKIARPFPNEQAARAANNGAYPPDLSLITKAREDGPDYVFGVLTGYKDAPADVKIPAGMYYNTGFPGHQIAMPQPLQDGQVTFADGSPNKLADEARNVVTFLQWAAEPELEARKRMGIHVLLFLVVAAGLLYAAKRKIWAEIH
ncbi:MAG TPA: cytochrome c1 [Stellaceae bacterium]|nr:cytochrome c1 [Stellaceae bacterium]